MSIDKNYLAIQIRSFWRVKRRENLAVCL